MSTLSEEKEYILKIARETISNAVMGKDLPKIELERLPEGLQQKGAAFITLTINNTLRGCIGSIEPYRPLAVDVQENALGAAFYDPRFPPLDQSELERVDIEVSLLTPPQPLVYDGPEDLIAKLRPHVDGVIIRRGRARSTFLPQVWDKIPDPRQFLAQLCMKAGLPANDYERPGLEVSTYQAVKITE